MSTPTPGSFPAGGSVARGERGRRRGRWAHAFGLARTYWCSTDWKFAWVALVLLVALQFGTASVFFFTNRWQQAFFNSVEQRDVHRFYPLIGLFLLILAAQVTLQLVNPYLSMLVSIRWRQALTDRYLARWMANNRFAEIERLRLIDNPDQRIAEDIAMVTGQSNGAGSSGSGGLLSLMMGALSAAASAAGFAIILMETAEPIRFMLFGHAITIPGSTIWYAVIYALAGSVIVAKVGRPFVRATMERQHFEANFRADLIHVRRNAGQIGFVGAVETEAAALHHAFVQIRRNFRTVIYATLGVNFVQHSYEVVRPVIPLFLLVPRYFAGAISFGQVMAGKEAFQSFASQISWFAQVYPSIGAQIACLNRLKALDDAIDMRRKRGISIGSIDMPQLAIATSDLAIFRPNGAPLLEIGDWMVRPGERWLIRGPSGTGKTTLLRAIAGLWPDGRGKVALGAERLMMFVPQRLYLPIGTLKSAVCFPDPSHIHDNEAITSLLVRVGLSDHIENLALSRHWQEELSPGEQQRVALARVLLHRPSLLVLDEATSALDPANAELFHREILAELPSVTLISVAHDDRLADYHTHQMTLGNGHVAHSVIHPSRQA